MTDPDIREVFIKNIPYDIDEDALLNWCLTFGPVEKCTLKYDREGFSRGFAFVTFESIDGHDNILSQAPHTCYGRDLLVRTAFNQVNSVEHPSNSSPEQFIQTTPFLSANEILNSKIADNSSIFDDNDHDRLALLRDELEANLECMQIAHEREINLLREKLKRETKLRKEAEESYNEAAEDWRKENTENIRLRTSLIKNVMQTFNIRKNLSRQTKDQLGQCTQMEKQCEDLKSNGMSSGNNETT